MQSSINHDPEPNFQQLKLAADKFLQNHKMLEFNLPLLSSLVTLSLCLFFCFDPDTEIK